MSKRTLLTAIGLIGIGVVFGVAVMTNFGSNAIERAFAQGTTLGAQTAPVATPPLVQALNDQFVAVSEATTKSVVFISVQTEAKKPEAKKRGQRPFPEEFYRFFGPDGEEINPREGRAAGSGVIITSDGYVVTNNHVVESAKAGGISVMTLDGKEHEATLVGRDPLTDLAVLKITGTFTPAHFGTRESVQIGQWVVAVGNPLGLKSTVTAGIVSAMGRGIGIVGSDELGPERNRYAVENFIQTDAAINPGNSGGGLFNLNGSLVGINTAIASQTGSYAGYGFAIPIDMVQSVAQDLIEDGTIQRGYIGVEITSVDETAAKAVGLKDVAGVHVNRVVRDGAAEAAGIEVGDVILAVDGKNVKTSNDLQNEIVLRRAGDPVNLDIWRDGKTIKKTLRLRSLDGNDLYADARAGEAPKEQVDAPVKLDNYGFTVAPLTAAQRKEFETSTGVAVTDVDRQGAVARRGLRPNTIILKADGQMVNSPSELKSVLSKLDAGDGVLFVVKDKDGFKMAVTVEVPEDNS